MLVDLHQHVLLISAVSNNQWRVMRWAGSLQLVLLLALTSRATGLDIPIEVEQPPTLISHTPGPIYVLPYDNIITISCEARGNPPPVYSWTKDGKDIAPLHNGTDHTQGTFIIERTHIHLFEGKYRCYASNKLGTAMTEEIELIVHNSPKFPKEDLNPIVVDEGDQIILHCNPPEEGIASDGIFWMSAGLKHIEQDERVSIGTDGNLYFSNALTTDSRQDYFCHASFSKIGLIAQKNPMTVEVKSLKPNNGSTDRNDGSTAVAPPLRKPVMLLPSGVQTEKVLLKGENLQLECLPGGYPTPKVKWIKMGEDLPPRTKFDNYGKQLKISHVKENDGGKYMCTASNSVGVDVHYVDVIVEEPPKWLTGPPQSQLTVSGSDVHIKCSVSGKPQPDITWRRNGEPFRDDPQTNRRVLDDTVVIHKASPEDTAVYQCEASNIHGSVLANINIMVMTIAPWILTEDNQNYAVILGGDVVVTCNFFSSPPSNISWYKDGTPVIEGERFSLQNGSLQIIRAEKDDNGKYMCVAENTEGKSAINAVLEVKDHTRIEQPPEDMQVISGTTAQLICHAVCDESLQSTFEVVWKKDEEETPLSFEENSRYIVKEGMLQIMNVNLSDQGFYTCIAHTSLDEVNATALLTVLDVPDAPTNLEITELKGPRNILLSWVPGNHHNSSVSEFVVECEESLWEPGRWKELQKVPGNQATAELALHGHLNYQFRVYAVNAVGPGPPSEPTERHKTPTAAPDRNPENITIKGHLPHQMDISWVPLLPIEHNGPGLEYKVSYRKLGIEDKWTEHLVKRPSFLVKNTPTFIPYEVKIHSRNSHGWAPEPKVLTGYSGEDVPTAAPGNVSVEVMNATVMKVNWTRVPTATLRGHMGGYVVHWVRKRNLLNPNKVLDERHTLSFRGERSHVFVPGLEPYSEYKLTVNVFNKKGNGPNSDPVTFNTSEGVPMQVPILTASNAQKDSVLLVWGPPRETNGILTGYLLHYYLINETSLEEVDSREINITGADTTQWQLQDLEEGSLYRFSLSACTRAGCGPAQAEECSTVKHAVPALLNISSYVSDTFAKISWTAREEQQDSQLYVAYMNNRDGNWRISEAVNTSQSFHVIDGLEPGASYTVRLLAKSLLDNASLYEDVIHTRVKAVGGQQSDFSSQGWFIGTMCAVALLTLVALMACFVRRNKGGKYAGTPPPSQRRDMFSMEKVKEKEDLHPDVESLGMNDDTFCEYSDSEEKPLNDGSLCSRHGDSVSRDSLVDYADGGGEFNEDGSFIGEYSGRKHRGSVSEPSGPGAITA